MSEYDENSFDSFDEPVIRCCERCGSGNDKSKPDAMLGEVQLAFGLVSWICHDCRKDWHRMFKSHALQRNYSEASMRLEFWKARVGPDTPPEAVNEGIKLLFAMDDLELKINSIAQTWLVGDLDEVRTL